MRSEAPAVKILLVDDHVLFRVGTRHALAIPPDFEVIAEASTARDAFRAIECMDGVAGVHLAINEIDETYDSIWPFSDTAYIVTRLGPESFAAIVAPLQPDTIELGTEPFANPPPIPAAHHLIRIWWD